MPVIGLLNTSSPDLATSQLRAFRQGLGEAGFVAGSNVVIEERHADDQFDRLPTMAAELVRNRVSVIAAVNGLPSAIAAKAATTTIPIVFLTGADPVAWGLVASLNRPGGNITGVTLLTVEVGPKRLELLHELIPRTTRIALLVNPTSPTASAQAMEMKAAAAKLGLTLDILRASTEPEIDTAFLTLAQLGAGAIFVGISPFFSSHSKQLAELTVRHAVPAIFSGRDFVAAGGLMSYGNSTVEGHHTVGVYTGRILKGEKPADLPVQQATKFELILNLKTAKTLGITYPETLLATADELINQQLRDATKVGWRPRLRVNQRHQASWPARRNLVQKLPWWAAAVVPALGQERLVPGSGPDLEEPMCTDL
jgi:putative tryptophan/tyrosine transport system substrate-binding protein